MASMLLHRGPDGYGVYRDPDVALVHTRLSIIDLEGGSQPLCNEDGTIWLTFNGEIFNYVELRKTLKARGHTFRTQTDSEVVVHAFEEWGAEAWSRFNGQFAFALWDRARGDLWLVRDPMGILPLHYSLQGGQLYFASEAKAIFASGACAPRFDAAGLQQALCRWSVRSPRTVFEGVRSVPPGTALRFDPRLNAELQSYWRTSFEPDPNLADISTAEAADRLQDALSQAVRLRLRADVPVGAYLSGGLDSSVIGQLVRGVSGDHLETFAVRFADPHFDETQYQRLMSARLGTEHHEVLCGDGEIAEHLPEVIWHAETPLLRTGPVPLYLLSGLVQSSARRVVLTGEGADELLAGYNIFKEDRIRRFWARQPTSTARPALLGRLYPYVARGRGGAMWRAFFKRGMTELDDPLYSHRLRWRNAQTILPFLAPEWRQDGFEEQLDAETQDDLPTDFLRWSPLARAQFLEIETFMSTYLLACQGDRVAMAHGVEVRYPFLDPQVVQLASALPDRVKLQGLKDKLVLRKVAARSLPAEIFDRPKQPYRAPVTAPFFSSASPEYVQDMLSSQGLLETGLIQPELAERLQSKARAGDGKMASAREEMALMAVLSLQLLAHSFARQWPDRMMAARARLAEVPCVVLEDRVDAHGGVHDLR